MDRALLGTLRLRFWVPLLLCAAAATPGWPQLNEYERRYGATVEVRLDDLLQMPESYAGKSVRTRGELEMAPTIGTQRYSLRGTFGGRLLILPMREAESEFHAQAPRWIGHEVEVTGLFGAGSGNTTYFINVWGFLGPPDEDKDKTPRAQVPDATLEELVTKPGKLDGRLVRVRGQFRGQNLFGDLPAASRRRGSDWVIKEDLFAAWVSGRKPRGSGWAFDPELKRDSGKWLQVVGRVRTERGVVTLEATEVSLAKEPGPAAQAAQPPPPPPPRPRKAPVVVFSLPLDGEREVPPGTVFQLQFSKDMDEPSFKDHVVLRYAGRAQPGDRELDAVRISYDGGRRALNIDPGDLLRPGRVVEILLLPGIVDIDGLPLETRPGRKAGGAVDVLRFQIAAGLMGGL